MLTFGPGDLVDVEISDLAHGGSGVGRVRGFVILVRRALPGDIVRARITARRPNYAEAEIVEQLDSSPMRIEPRCDLFSECGGCQWMDLSYEHQLDAKERQVDQALKRIGKLDGFYMKRIVRAPDIYYYRNKLDLAFGEGPAGLTLGFHRESDQDKILDIPSCLIGSQRMDLVARSAHRWLAGREYRPEGSGGPRSILKHLVVREGKRTGEVLANLVTSEGQMPDAADFGKHVRQSCPFVVGVVRTVSPNGRSHPRSAEHSLSGRTTLRESVAGLRFQVAAGAFFQVNTEQAEHLFQLTRRLAVPKPGMSVLDLYCGVGSLSLVLARRSSRVLGVESSPDAIRCARTNAAANDLKNASFIEGEARRVVTRLAAGGETFDVVTVNPPRSGMHADLLNRLPELRPARIVYISCNPATLARDCAGLRDAGYRLREVHPVDMFPHSYHVEAVALLEGPRERSREGSH